MLVPKDSKGALGGGFSPIHVKMLGKTAMHFERGQTTECSGQANLQHGPVASRRLARERAATRSGALGRLAPCSLLGGAVALLCLFFLL